MEIKEIIPNLNKPVKYNDSLYTLSAGIIRKKENGETYYQAEVMDKNKNSVRITRLTDVEVIE